MAAEERSTFTVVVISAEFGVTYLYQLLRQYQIIQLAVAPITAIH